MGSEEEKEAEYHSKDFEWEEVREEVEKDPSLSHHSIPFTTATSSTSNSYDDFFSEPWKSFHKRHSSGRFFKERRYLLKEFPELLSCGDFSKVLEVGCGNGSTVLPILRTKALEKAREMVDAVLGLSIKHRFHAFFCDFSVNGFPSWLFCDACQKTYPKRPDCLADVEVNNEASPSELSSLQGAMCCIGGVDFVTLIFTLSAVPFQRMPPVITECISVLKPGGLLLFRDYGLYDMTMLRFQPNKRVGFREYVRSDGTHSYFFSLDTVRELFLGAGFIELELEYCCVKSVNRRSGKDMRRVWVHAKFQKPI
ncbi:uncharacterized protein LOC131230841 isoform X2 [Magnolia sinica]|uniref:uncharacterized protein LOC131230841 isoform X2 n=1 Tax=Magnolia sinica TaxID=86752 RepID=UPI002658C87A|nr:uncharacterized protein LOC131230841 isoform X2 [Magnolia sinica]